MPAWFASWSIIAVFAYAASLSGAMMIETTLLSNGLVLPLWLLAVNLWWVMRLIGPWVWFARRGKPVTGFAISSAMLAALVAVISRYVAYLRATILPQPAASLTESAPTATPAKSLEMEWTDNRPDLHSCETLCQQVLTGGDIAWLRVPATPPAVARRAAKLAGENDLSRYFDTVLKGQGIDRLHALITYAADGSYDAYGDTFLIPLNTGTADCGLIPLLGQFGFDPTPLLRQRWTSGIDERADALVLQAACRADARWFAALAPFVAEAGQSILPKSGDPKFFAAELRQTVLVLGHLGRADLARQIASSIDWQVVDAIPAIGKLGLSPPLTQPGLSGLVDNPNPC